MNRKCGSGKLPVWMLLPGTAGLLLRKMLYAAAVDDKGLLPRNHPLETALLVLSAAVLIAVVWIARKAEAGGEPTSGSLAAFGNLAAGAGILSAVLTGTPITGNYLESLWHILGLAAPVCLLLAAIVRALGKRPFFLLYVVACLFFLMHIVTRYPLWSGNPQMQDYLFSLLGAMSLTFFAFYTAAQETGSGNPRMRVGMGLAAIYLCTAELARSARPALYLGGLLWVLAELGSIRYAFADQTK